MNLNMEENIGKKRPILHALLDASENLYHALDMKFHTHIFVFHFYTTTTLHFYFCPYSQLLTPSLHMPSSFSHSNMMASY
jgi:hypothetical protein